MNDKVQIVIIHAMFGLASEQPRELPRDDAKLPHLQGGDRHHAVRLRRLRRRHHRCCRRRRRRPAVINVVDSASRPLALLPLVLAPLGARRDLVPAPLPLLPPGEGAIADDAVLAGQVLLLFVGGARRAGESVSSAMRVAVWESRVRAGGRIFRLTLTPRGIAAVVVVVVVVVVLYRREERTCRALRNQAKSLGN